MINSLGGSGSIRKIWPHRRRVEPQKSRNKSGNTYTLRRLSDGSTEIDVVIVREGMNLNGRLLGFVQRPSAGGLCNCIEARNREARVEADAETNLLRVADGKL